MARGVQDGQALVAAWQRHLKRTNVLWGKTSAALLLETCQGREAPRASI